MCLPDGHLPRIPHGAVSSQRSSFRTPFLIINLQPCGGLAYGVGANGHTSCWNVQTGKLLDTGSSNDDISYISCAWSTKMAASGSKSKLVTLWTDC